MCGSLEKVDGAVGLFDRLEARARNSDVRSSLMLMEYTCSMFGFSPEGCLRCYTFIRRKNIVM